MENPKQPEKTDKKRYNIKDYQKTCNFCKREDVPIDKQICPYCGHLFGNQQLSNRLSKDLRGETK